MSIEWLIIGGGIHGVHLAARLIGEAGVAPDQLRIVDPADRLLARWRDSHYSTFSGPWSSQCPSCGWCRCPSTR
jgi:cation diffusion facilitator CzcD-associated flavoprotein CzcO